MTGEPSKRSGGSGRRAQGHTLEAIAAAFLLLASISFAIQMTAVTPLSASTSSQHLENQLQYTAAGVMASTAQTGHLSRAVRYWNDSNARFHGSPDGGYYSRDPPANALGRAFNRSYDRRNVAYNVYLTYENTGGEQVRKRLLYRGQPSDHAIRSSRTVVVHENDPLVDSDGSLNESVTVSSAETYFLPDARPGEPVRNVVRIEVVAWRI